MASVAEQNKSRYGYYDHSKNQYVVLNPNVDQPVREEIVEENPTFVVSEKGSTAIQAQQGGFEQIMSMLGSTMGRVVKGFNQFDISYRAEIGARTVTRREEIAGDPGQMHRYTRVEYGEDSFGNRIVTARERHVIRVDAQAASFRTVVDSQEPTYITHTDHSRQVELPNLDYGMHNQFALGAGLPVSNVEFVRPKFKILFWGIGETRKRHVAVNASEIRDLRIGYARQGFNEVLK